MGILSESQIGFTKNYSTNFSFLDLVDKTTRALDNKEVIVGVILDLFKAFDAVNDSLLLQKLEHYGVRGIALNWFGNYITKHYQCVKYNNEVSEKKEISCGVPQGSILGPLLFLIYINDISYSSNLRSFVLFPDDTNLLISHKDSNTLMNQMNKELGKISTWLALDKLSLNLAKTHFTLFKSTRKKMESELILKINDTQISQVKHTKFLGVIIDERLNRKEHINIVANKISKLTGLLCKARHPATRSLIKSMCYALIYPYKFYGNVVWANTYQSNLNKIYKLQKKIVRVMAFKDYNHSSKPLFNEQNILNVYQVNNFVIGNLMHQYSKNHLPVAVMSLFKTNDLVYNYNTRCIKNLHKPKAKTNKRKITLCYKGMGIYSNLPYDLKQSDCGFKRKFKRYILVNEG